MDSARNECHRLTAGDLKVEFEVILQVGADTGAVLHVSMPKAPVGGRANSGEQQQLRYYGPGAEDHLTARQCPSRAATQLIVHCVRAVLLEFNGVTSACGRTARLARESAGRR